MASSNTSFVNRVSSLDPGYATGNLSLFPQVIDTQNQLYQVSNNAETTLTQTLTYNSRYIFVEDTSLFQPQGLLKVGEELIYYQSVTPTSFTQLKRGFAGSRQGQWSIGLAIVGSVQAEPHNAVKDALFNLETDLGTQINPTAASLNGILQGLENRFLAPKPIYQAAPLVGPPPLTVTFQNFSGGDPIRYLWTFGDGGTSTEVSPTYTYLADGSYTVQLNMITQLGAQSVSTKTNYVTVDSAIGPQFFYVTPVVGSINTVFQFVDQTVGLIQSRYWVFDDGNADTETDPDIHTITHQYLVSGTYNPSLLIVFQDNSLVRLQLSEPIMII